MASNTGAPAEIEGGVVGLIPVDMNNTTTIQRHPVKSFTNKTVNSELLQLPVLFEIDSNKALGMQTQLGLMNLS